MEHQAAINEIREICHDIGCSSMSPDLCINRPFDCAIIRKVIRETKKEKADDQRREAAK